MSKNKFQGVFTALVTPFYKGNVDFESLGRLVAQQRAGGVCGFVINGTTGESPTLEAEEIREIFGFVRDAVGLDFPIVLGVGTNNTTSTVAWAQMASEWKADGALAVVPYYNKPPQRGLFLHFKTVAENSDIPILLYNVPGRTVAGLELDTVVKLSKVPRIAGIKESTGNLDFMEKIKVQVAPDFALLSGDDATCVDFCFRGGHGVVSVCSHVIPKELVDLLSAAKSGQQDAVQKYKSYKELMDCLYQESNPIPVKNALQQMGILKSDELRLPLVSLDSSCIGAMTSCLKNLKKI